MWYNISMKMRVISLLAVVLFFGHETIFAQNLSLFNYDGANKVLPNCKLRKEFNYFMNQWTTNEVCDPQVIEVKRSTISPYYAKQNSRTLDTGNSGNIYLGNTRNSFGYDAPAPQVTYYRGPALSNTGYSANTWNGYGSASNYLLGSFGGGIGSYGYYNNYYPNSLYSYLPSSSGYGYYDYDDYGYDTYDTYGYADDGYSYDWYSDSSVPLVYDGDTIYDSWTGNSATYCEDCSFSDLVDMAGGWGNVDYFGNIFE